MNIHIAKNGGLQASWIFLMEGSVITRGDERCFKVTEHGRKFREIDFNFGLKIMKRLQSSAKKFDYITLSGNMINEVEKEEKITTLFNGGKISLGL